MGQVLDWVFGLARYDWWSPLTMVVAALGAPVAVWISWPRPIEESIAQTSLQAQALSIIYDGDIARLDADLVAALSVTAPVAEVEKEGKTVRYEVGTVATINHTNRKLYFLAITNMDENNNAQGTPDGLWVSLNRLWAEIRRTSNGRPVCIPVIGGGLSRMSSIVPTLDSLRFTVLSFIFASRLKPVCEELRIVLRPEDYERLDRLELQEFLTSLKPS